jgi:group II intron reverse transcriptase/maturase
VRRRDTGLLEGKITGTPIPETSVSTKLQRIADLAREAKQRAFLSLAHHIDLDFLREAFRRTRKDGAPGVDSQTGQEYELRLEENLRSLLDRFKAGTYKAPPVRRTYVPKGDGSMRPLGIPTFEDKVLQRAVTMVLEAVYEQDFLPCSHGYRPGRSAHTALRELDGELMSMGGAWIVELDIRRYFDTLDHAQLRTILDQRVRDGVLRRTIDKWLKAGVMEGLELSRPDAGTPQGGVISPLLANVYLHVVLDKWFHEDVLPRLRGRGSMVRYADDAVLVFANESDARRVMDVLPKRFGKYGLTLHPIKTRLVRFRPPNRGRDEQQPGSGSFDMLGFTHYWAKSRRGFWVAKRKTASSRFTRTLTRWSEWLGQVRHEPVGLQHRLLGQKLRGHYGYFGLAGNYRALARLRFEVQRRWRRALARRHRGGLTWVRYLKLLERFPLPRPHVRSWPLAANP